MLLRTGGVGESRSRLDGWLGLSEEAKADDESVAALLLSHCELNLAESNVDEAERFAAEALELAGRSHAITSIADAHAWLGRVASVRGDDAAADAEFASAFEVLREPPASRALMNPPYARYPA